METTRCLRQEHQLILRVIACFEVALARSRKSGHAPAEVFAPFVEFFQNYADKCHHCKEEDRLFPQLEKAGFPRDSGPIGCMLAEHVIARAHVKAIAESLDAADKGDNDAVQRIFSEGEAYAALLRAHISKEDNALFEMADQAIQGESLTQLTDEYARVESDPEYIDTIGRCRAIAEQLIETYTPAEG